MVNSPNIARIGALIGDNTRAKILANLMCGKALTASELATAANVTAQTATSHLAKLNKGGLICERKQGRYKYFTLTNEEVASILESLMSFTSGFDTNDIFTGPKDEGMRKARVCYNHLAGSMGVQLYDSLLAMKYLRLDSGNLALSKKGEQFMEDFGINMHELRSSRSPLCKVCLDWSERRDHLSGSVGRAFLVRFESLDWIKRDPGFRTIRFSKSGERAFKEIFKLNNPESFQS